MKKYLRIILVFIVAIIFLLIGRYIWKNDEHVLAFQANKNIDVNSLELMMTKEEVYEILGPEDNYMPGWGCYEFDYVTKGICVTFLDDGDTKFYNKVKEIEVLNSNYKIYNIYVGMKYNDAIESLKKQGFKEDDNQWLWKGNIYIDLYESNDGLINKIMIGIKDRIACERVY